MEKRFKELDKDGSGELTRADIIVMLMAADSEDKADPLFKMNIKFLTAIIQQADKNDDAKISLAGRLRHISLGLGVEIRADITVMLMVLIEILIESSTNECWITD